MFRLASVHKCYAGKPVLCTVDLEIPRHQRTALIGPSGSGKSTVLGVMTGLLKPDKGQVYFEGEVVSEVRLPEIRKHLGYVIQDGGLFPHLTALENVTLMARYVGWDSTAIRDRVRELSTLACLPEDVLKRYPAEMSGGHGIRVIWRIESESYTPGSPNGNKAGRRGDDPVASRIFAPRNTR